MPTAINHAFSVTAFPRPTDTLEGHGESRWAPLKPRVFPFPRFPCNPTCSAPHATRFSKHTEQPPTMEAGRPVRHNRFRPRTAQSMLFFPAFSSAARGERRSDEGRLRCDRRHLLGAMSCLAGLRRANTVRNVIDTIVVLPAGASKCVGATRKLFYTSSSSLHVLSTCPLPGFSYTLPPASPSTATRLPTLTRL